MEANQTTNLAEELGYTRSFSELAKDEDFLCAANCHADTTRMRNKLLDDILDKYGKEKYGNSRLLNMALRQLMEDERELAETERELKDMGYTITDVVAAQIARLI